MKNAPCVRFASRIRPKISENPDESRNSKPPSDRLLRPWTIQNCIGYRSYDRISKLLLVCRLLSTGSYKSSSDNRITGPCGKPGSFLPYPAETQGRDRCGAVYDRYSRWGLAASESAMMAFFNTSTTAAVSCSPNPIAIASA